MSSILQVNTISSTTNVSLLDRGYQTQPSTVLERVVLPADGSSTVYRNGTMTTANVTAVLDSSTTYIKITGSEVSYLPPAGTTLVLFKFNFAYGWQTTAHSIQHFKFYIDSDEVTNARFNISGVYAEDRYSFEWPIRIGPSTDTTRGIYSTWTTAKTFSLYTRRYAAGSNGGFIHSTQYWDGTNSFQLSKPWISFTALG